MSNYRNPSNIDELIIHCSATQNGKNFTIADIDKWHDERGFNRSYIFIGVDEYIYGSVGYHFVVHLDGTIHLGRRLDETGAHAKGHNERSVGVCMIGTDKFTIKQWVALQGITKNLKANYQTINVIGHNEISSKICPGFNVHEWLINGMHPLDNHCLIF